MPFHANNTTELINSFAEKREHFGFRYVSTQSQSQLDQIIVSSWTNGRQISNMSHVAQKLRSVAELCLEEVQRCEYDHVRW